MLTDTHPLLPVGEGWTQVGELMIAFVLAAAIGLERELRHKSAGIRTYTVIGLGAALFMLTSKYAFGNVLHEGQVVLDPSRMAAQIVSGLGFIGAGIIFVRKDSVHGLTTAASVWFTAAVGAAAAGGLVLLATVSTVIYFVAILALPALARAVRKVVPATPRVVTVRYSDGQGLLRVILRAITDCGLSVRDMVTTKVHDRARAGLPFEPALVEVTLELFGEGDLDEVIHRLSDVDGIHAVHIGGADEDEPDE